jgi:transcription antitermination factor NusG
LVGSPKTGRKTKGGEALTETATLSEVIPRPESVDGWHVLWTRSNCESLVHDQLATHNFQLFLPTIESWFRRGGARRRVRVPLFRGYLFLRHAMDKESYLRVSTARGLVRILGERWDRLWILRETEMETIKQILGAGRLVMPYPYLRNGQRVRIKRGPLMGVEGVLARTNPKKGLLVVSVDLLQRSVAVHLDCTDLEVA